MKRIGTAILSAALMVASLPAAAMTTQESEVFDLINMERAKRGCGPLSISNKLTRAAEGHANAMVRKNFFGHVGPDGSTLRSRTRSAGYGSGKAMAENIAAGWSTPQKVVEQWMSSSGHRKNILTCKYNETGIALVYDSSGNILPGQRYPMKYYWVQVFGKN